MNRTIKFPKERIIIENVVNKEYEAGNYLKVMEQREIILKDLDSYHNKEILIKLIKSCFYLSAFERTVTITMELLKHEIEDFTIYYYCLCSLIALGDVYQAKNMIKKSKVLNEESIKYYYSEDGANYSNILNLSKELFDDCGLCLLMVNYVSEVSKEIVEIEEIKEKEYLMFRFFDLINLVYEIGTTVDVLTELERTLKIVFEIEV